ncbi:hypothetical protein [Geopseudomonas aromaticivorans]
MLLLTEWLGSLCGVIGALLISANVRLSPWGWWLFLVSSVSLCLYAVMQQAWGLLLLNSCFVATNVTGLIRWWWPSFRAARAASHSGVTP